MTASTPVERIGELLESAKYRRLPSPLEIAGLTFEISAAFVGSDRSSDLVLVADTAFETPQHILQAIEGIGRALDVMRSMRPVTAILAGPRPPADVIELLSKVCRVLPIGAPADEDPDVTLMNWLAVLLPLSLPAPSQGVADPLALVRTQVADLGESVAGLIDHAENGADTVQESLHTLLNRTLEDDEEAAT